MTSSPMVVIGAATMGLVLVACGGGDGGAKGEFTPTPEPTSETEISEESATSGVECLKAVAALTEARALDAVETLEEDAASGELPSEELGFRAELLKGVIEGVTKAADLCLSLPRVTFDILCDDPAGGYNENLWVEEWCG